MEPGPPTQLGRDSAPPDPPPLPDHELGLHSFPEILEWLIGTHYREWAVSSFHPSSSFEPGDRPSCALMAKLLLSVGDLPGSSRRSPIEKTYADALQQLRTRSARRLPEECLERATLALNIGEAWRAVLEQKAADWNAAKGNRIYDKDVVEAAIRATLKPAPDPSADQRIRSTGSDDGSRFLGPFEVLGQLGRSHLAVVWRARDPSLDREIAIKEPVLPPEDGQQIRAEFAERFLREGRAAARLNHPGIVTVYSAMEFDGRPQIVMELVRGRTLRQVLSGGPLTVRQTYALMDQLLAATGYAHEHQVVHRDVKPDNVFVTDDGVVKLADFGIAHVGQVGPALTREGSMLGTPAYMAPEQIRGEPVDARCDVFALGVVAYECLTGANPFGCEPSTHYATIIHRIVSEPTPPLAIGGTSALPLAQVIMRALEKETGQRFDNAATMLIAWRAALTETVDPQAELAAIGGTSPDGMSSKHSSLRGLQATSDKPLAEGELNSESPEAIVDLAQGACATAAPRPLVEQPEVLRATVTAAHEIPSQPSASESVTSAALSTRTGDPVSSPPADEPSGSPGMPRRRHPPLLALVGVCAVLALIIGVVVRGADSSRGEHTGSALSHLTAQAVMLDATGADLTDTSEEYQRVVESLNQAGVRNRVEVKAWNKELKERMAAYSEEVAAVKAYNSSPAGQGTPSYTTPKVYDSYGYLRSGGIYVPGTPGRKKELPPKPNPPARIEAPLDSQRRRLSALESRLTAIVAQIDADAAGPKLLPMVTAAKRNGEVQLDQVRATLQSLQIAVIHDRRKGEILLASRLEIADGGIATRGLQEMRGLLMNLARSQGIAAADLPWAAQQ